MSALRASYVAGDWVAISAPGRWLLVKLPPQDEAVQRCWERIHGGGDAEDVLDLLISRGVRATPAFALVWLTDAERRVVARGTGVVRVRSGAEVTDIEAGERMAWVDQLIDDGFEEITLLGGATGGSDVALPMAAGVTLAAAVSLSMQERPVSVSRQSSTTIVEPLPVEPIPAEPVPAEPIPAELIPAEPSPAESAVEVTPAVEVEVTPENVPDDQPSYDHLFGATQRPIPIAQLTDPGRTMIPPPEDDEIQAGPPAPTPSRTPSRDPSPSAAAPIAPPHPRVLIDSLPWSAEPQNSPDPVGVRPLIVAFPSAPAAVGASPDAVGHTINRAASPAQPANLPIAGPTVLATRCRAGHLTPPHSATCRVCNTPIATQEVFEIARPPLGVLRLSTGDAVTLDRGVLIGRAPSLPPGRDERPHLVRVPSPDNDVSRNHAEIVLDGWHVFVRDLGSTNGTTVTLPGEQSVRLRDGDPQLLENAAVIILADEIRCVFEVSG